MSAPDEARVASATTLGDDPFTSLAVHYGMLLGVSDLETLAGHAWAKIRLHNAWLHGEGVVHGLGVVVDTDQPEVKQREVKVAPGLALDGLGRELMLTQESCLDLAQWYDEHADELDPGAATFDAHVVARFRACLARPVPALVTSCEPASAETAYSRVQETVELFLRPGLAPPRSERYPRLRRLAGLPGLDGAPASSGVPDDDAAVDAERAAVAVVPDAERAGRWLAAVRRFAAEDVIAAPTGADGRFPTDEPAEVVLADLHGLSVGTDQARTVSVDRVDTSVRWSHVATTTVAELAAFPPPGAGGGASPAPGPAPGPGPEPDAGGPRVRPDTAARSGDTITVGVTSAPVEATLTGGVEVHHLDPEQGWLADEIAEVIYVDAEAAVRVRLTSPPGPAVLRLLVRGTGARPVIGEVGGVHVPLAGLEGGPPGGRHEGHDAAIIIEGS